MDEQDMPKTPEHDDKKPSDPATPADSPAQPAKEESDAVVADAERTQGVSSAQASTVITPHSDGPADTSAISTPTPVTTPQPKKHGMAMAAIIVLIILVLGAGAAAAYFGYYVPNQPQNILKTALTNSLSNTKVQSASYQGNVSITGTNSKNAATNSLVGAFSGAYEQGGAFNLSATLKIGSNPVTVDVRNPDGNTLYVQVSGLKNVLNSGATTDKQMSTAFAPVVGALDGQWIQISQAMLEQLGVKNVPTSKISDADRQKLAKAYDENQFLVVTKVLPEETLHGMPSYHYEVTVDRIKLESFLTAVQAANLDSFKMTTSQLNTAKKALQQINHTDLPAEVWIAKTGKLIDQVKLTSNDGQTSRLFQVSIYNFNKPVSIAAPSGAKSLTTVLSELLTGNSAASKAALDSLQKQGISL